jgi:hypothetical protein
MFVITPEDLGQTKTPEIPAKPQEEKIDLPKPVRKNKPSIEGINAPKVTNRLVQAQSSPKQIQINTDANKILLPSMVAVSHKARNIFLIILALVILGGGGFVVYEKYFLKKEAVLESFSQIKAPEINPNENIYGNNSLVNDTQTLIASSTDLNTKTALATSTPPANSSPKLKINSTSVGYLNVRSQPATSGKLLLQVKPGEVYEYTEVKNNWYKIILPNNQSGWVSGEHITKQ